MCHVVHARSLSGHGVEWRANGGAAVDAMVCLGCGLAGTALVLGDGYARCVIGVVKLALPVAAK